MGTTTDFDTIATCKQQRLAGGADVAALIAIAIAGGCAQSVATSQRGEYKYVGADSGRVLTFNLLKNEVHNGHRILTIQPCDANKFRVCLRGDVTLAIPNGNLKKGDTWELDGSRFSVVSVDPKEPREYVIVSEPSSDRSFDIFFNGANGIRALRLSAGGEVFTSTDPCGLGCSIGGNK